jgi:hypothetical protein
MVRTKDTRTDEQKAKDEAAKHNYHLVKVDTGEKFDLGKGYWEEAFKYGTPFLLMNSYMIPLLLQQRLTEKVFPNGEVSPEDCFILAESICTWGLTEQRLMFLKDDMVDEAFSDPYFRERLKIPEHEELKSTGSTKETLEERSDEDKKQQNENPKQALADNPTEEQGVNENVLDPRSEEDKNPSTPVERSTRQKNRDKH